MHHTVYDIQGLNDQRREDLPQGFSMDLRPCELLDTLGLVFGGSFGRMTVTIRRLTSIGAWLPNHNPYHL